MAEEIQVPVDCGDGDGEGGDDGSCFQNLKDCLRVWDAQRSASAAGAVAEASVDT